METHIVRIQYPNVGEQVHIEPISDIHVGSKFHMKEKLAEVIERIRTQPTRYTVIMGDIFDATPPDHKFFDAETLDPELPTFEEQFEYILLKLLPIRHKILAVLTGNHDERVRLHHNSNIVLRLVKELNREYPEHLGIPALPRQIKYMGYSGFIRLVFYRKFDSGEEHIDSRYELFVHHGFFTGRRFGGNINSLEDMSRDNDADIFLTGHSHNVGGYKRPQTCMDDKGNLSETAKIFAICGSFLKSYNTGVTSYAEVKGMPPTRVGTITVSIDPYYRKLQIHA
jgi:predicted phosphodiesterase